MYSRNVHANFEITGRPSNSTGHVKQRNEIIIMASRLRQILLVIYRSDALVSSNLELEFFEKSII